MPLFELYLLQDTFECESPVQMKKTTTVRCLTGEGAEEIVRQCCATYALTYSRTVAGNKGQRKGFSIGSGSPVSRDRKDCVDTIVAEMRNRGCFAERFIGTDQAVVWYTP